MEVQFVLTSSECSYVLSATENIYDIAKEQIKNIMDREDISPEIKWQMRDVWDKVVDRTGVVTHLMNDNNAKGRRF